MNPPQNQGPTPKKKNHHLKALHRTTKSFVLTSSDSIEQERTHQLGFKTNDVNCASNDKLSGISARNKTWTTALKHPKDRKKERGKKPEPNPTKKPKQQKPEGKMNHSLEGTTASIRRRTSEATWRARIAHASSERAVLHPTYILWWQRQFSRLLSAFLLPGCHSRHILIPDGCCWPLVVLSEVSVEPSSRSNLQNDLANKTGKGVKHQY